MFVDAEEARVFFSKDAKEQRTAFCWMLRCESRCVVPFEKTRAVIFAACAIVARGAVVMVKWEREEVRVVCFRGVGFGWGGEARFMFSIKGVVEVDFVGESWRSLRRAAEARVSLSMLVMALWQMSNAFRRSPVCEATFFEMNWIAAGCRKGT